MVLNDLADSFCKSQKNAGLKGLKVSVIVVVLSSDSVESYRTVASSIKELFHATGKSLFELIKNNDSHLLRVKTPVLL